jgi:hypothetical protein
MESDTTSSSGLDQLLEEARRRLVETGTRNRLVHVNRGARRSNSLEIVNERSADVFELLRVSGKRMRFSAQGVDDPDEQGDGALSPAAGEEGFDEARYRDLYLETPLGPEALHRRLLRLFTDARTSEEEHGFNILYLAMGFLKWFESPSSRTPREAPLVLLPVSLVRNERRATFDLVARDDDIVTNLPLQERLRGDFGIDLPAIEDLQDGDEWRPGPYLDRIADLVAERRGWEVDRDGMQLGFFSFAKLLMLRDLDPQNWSGASLQDNALLRGLLAEGFEREPPLFGAEERLDARLDPAKMVQVVDADASQTKVIEEVRAGRNLVVQGPPGTGKSQTIANIIAGAVHDEKRVLFVAEKMAALTVVHDRLNKLGLGDLCLELHSRKSNKKALLEELDRALRTAQSPSQPERTAAHLKESRDRLNEIAGLLHEPVPGFSFTPFSVISEISGFVGRDTPPPSLRTGGLEHLDDAARLEVAESVRAFASLIQDAGRRPDHPFARTRALDLQPTDLRRLDVELGEALAALDAHAELRERVAQRTGMPAPASVGEAKALAELLATIAKRPEAATEGAEALIAHAGTARLTEALAAGRAWRTARDEAAAHFSDAAWQAPAADLRARLAPGATSFWARIFGKYRAASAELAGLMQTPLPRKPAERLARIDQLLDVQAKRRTLDADEVWLKEVLGGAWRGERTGFAALEDVASWLSDLRQAGAELDAGFVATAAAIVEDAQALSEELSARTRALETSLAAVVERLDYAPPGGAAVADVPLNEWHGRLSAMKAAGDRYAEWGRFQMLAGQLEAAGLSSLLDALDDGTLPPERAVDEFLYASAEARWAAARAARPALDDLRHVDRDALVDRFRSLDTAQMEETRRLLRALHAERLPQGALGEMALLRGEIAKKRRHIPIRKLMQGAGGVIQRIKPVFMMSPISIAQFLPPDALDFDLLVIDEASQVRPEEALGAVARCRQIVVVGDQKQLPPTSFFDRVASDEDGEDEVDAALDIVRATEMESILSLCEARGMNDGMLEWHYRSRDPSLIRVNNAEFYEDRLILPPSPVQDDPDYGLALTPVQGVYSSKSRGDGRAGTNRIEAEAVVRRLAEHARARPDLSIGLVAFSKAQSDMLTEVVERMRREDADLEALLRETKPENVFVKNIENVQGDERDVILISVGYGPHEPGGRLASMNFGPVNSDGGERRLNVLFSRARVRCEVFCSFDPGEIDLSRTSKRGPAVLKRFLEYAKSGQLHLPEPTGGGADSPFEEDVAAVIRGLGFTCDPQVGSAGFRIDLGVRHPDRPGQYILAVECDGATYHGALWARERDRLRQDVLEGMGWRFHRIWSTDWFYRRGEEIERLRAALEAARTAEAAHYTGSNVETPSADPEPTPTPEVPPDPAVPDPDPPAAPAYERATVRAADGSTPPHEVPPSRLARLLSRIVEEEGPLHVEEAARRVASAHGLQRAGRRVQEATERAAEVGRRQALFVADGAFLLTEAQRASPPVRDRSGETAPTTRADYLPQIEIQAAARTILAESGRVPRDELITAVARRLGFSRTGQDLRARIAASLPDDAASTPETGDQAASSGAAHRTD